MSPLFGHARREAGGVARTPDAGAADPGPLVLFGGTSDIGLAIVEELLARGPAPVRLVARADSPRLESARARVVAAGASQVRIVDLDVRQLDAHERAVRRALGDDGEPVGATAASVDSPLPEAGGVIDAPLESGASGVPSGAVVGPPTVIIAFGLLGDQEQAWTDAAATRAMFTVNTTAAASIGALVAAELRERVDAAGEAPGRIIAISSVAAERVRRSNFVYGASKAGMDGFFLGLGEALAVEGIEVLVVRPGFVHSTMTAGRRAGLAVQPRTVARATVRALDRHRRVVRVPAVFTPLMAVYRNLPARLARLLPL